VCDERGHVVYRNQLAAGFSGARHADVLAEQEVSALLDLALGGATERRTLELYGPPRRVLVITGLPLHDGHRQIGAAVVIDDISERRRVDAIRRDFVANISHELKTPVGALGLLAETLLAEDDPDVTRRLAQRMQSEADRVGRIIDDLLDLSRIEAEEAPVREPISVSLVVAEAVERVWAVADQRSITVDAPEPSRRVSVLGDRRQLVSAVFNLLENAVKYSEDGSHVEVGVGTSGGFVDIAVVDHGIGIPARDLERVFERFYRVDRARSRDTGGTGLGLAIVRHVAANHGGDVTVTSHEGEGSTFTLRLPAGPGPVAVTAEAS
jgi:two-component system sensor histidine kinase SenX3